ncbi:MAG: nodulation protein NfeD [Treponemataceae bacterium]|nr:nodulation protein NfeD [Treponemataceae bacterium]
MKHRIVFWLPMVFCIGCLTVMGIGAESETSSTKGERTAVIIPIKGDIEPSLAAFIRRESRAALSDGAHYLIYEIDTFGGRVDTALQISSFIGSIKEAKTVAWVRSGPDSLGVSWSAGALIALSCSAIYMAPGTSIGAAAPVTVGPDGQPQPAGEKTVSAVRAQMAALAERNKHPVALALAMVDEDLEVWEIETIKGKQIATLQEVEQLEEDTTNEVRRIRLISPEGKLLSLTAGEAVTYGLARGLASDTNELAALLDPSITIVLEQNPGIADNIVSFLTSGAVQSVLILLGLVMLFLEINTPGFGIPGVVAIITFAVVFGSNFLLGTVDSLEMILFLIGVVLLAVEIFILPGFGITGISGIVLIGLSLVFSMQDFAIPELPWQWELLGRNVLVVVTGIILGIAGIAVLALAGPKIRIFDRLILKTQIQGTAGGPDPDNPVEGSRRPVPEEPLPDYGTLVGKTGVAVSVLRPAGKAEIEGTVYVVETNGAYVESGSPVRVVRVRGNRIIVEKGV